ncbi:MAG TPA: S-layer homology domain-containing protein [Candidatus Aquicultor sp.]|jgi:hypothetical protein
MSFNKLHRAKSIAVIIVLGLLLAINPVTVFALTDIPEPPDLSQAAGSATTPTVTVPTVSDAGKVAALAVPASPVIGRIPLINSGNASAFAVTGTAEASTTIFIDAIDSSGSKVSEGTSATASGTFSKTFNLSTLKDGTVTFSAHAQSNGGNSAATTKTVYKDTVAPTGTITSPANNTVIATATPQLVFSVNESGTITVLVDNTATAIKTSGEKLGPLADGAHTVEVRAVDAAGNGSSARSVFAVDTKTSAVTINCPLNGSTTTTASPLLCYSVNESDTVVTVKVDSAVVNTKAGEKLSALSSGSHTLIVEATDRAGNKGSAQSSFTTNVSSTTENPPAVSGAPTVTGTDPSNNSTNVARNKTVTVTFSTDIHEGTTTAYGGISLYSGSSNTTATAVTITKLISGKTLSIDPTTDLAAHTKYTLSIPATSIESTAGAALATAFTLSFTTQTNTVTVAAPQNLKVTSNSGMLALSWSASTDTSVTGYNVYRKVKESTATASKINTSTVTSTTYQDKTAQADVTYMYYVTAIDKAGNESAASNQVEATLASTSTTAKLPTDIPANATYKQQLLKLINRGAFTIPADGKFHPDKAIPRAEFAKAVYFIVGGKLNTTSASSFKDVDAKYRTFPYIEKLKSLSIMIGYPNGLFKPNNSITRAEVAKVVAVIRKLPSVASTLKDVGSSWAKGFIGAVTKAGTMNADSSGNFNPNATVTRAEAIGPLDSMMP